MSGLLEERLKPGTQQHLERVRAILAAPDPDLDRVLAARGRPVAASMGQSPLRAFIQAECCNRSADDGCHLLLAGCLVLRQRRCDYFERAVLPLIEIFPDRYPKVKAAYIALHQAAKAELGAFEDARRCGCGALLAKRQRVCPDCAEKRRRATYRAAQAKRRA